MLYATQLAILTTQQKAHTKMMDNLYLDKLKGRITESDYDRFYQNLKDEAVDISTRLEQLQEADDNFYITSRYVLELVNRAYDLFMSSEVTERKQLIKLVLQNVSLKDETLAYKLHKPFDLIVNSNECLEWRHSLGALRTFRWSSLQERLSLIKAPGALHK